MIDPNAESIALVSREIFEALPKDFQLIEVGGTHLVKGKNEGLDVYQLIGSSAPDPSDKKLPVETRRVST